MLTTSGINTYTPVLAKSGIVIQQEETHKVKPGETLSGISRKYGVSVADLLKWNPDAANLKAGQVLVVKKPKGDLGSSSNQPPAAPTGSNGGTHIVAKGETLSAIARKYGVSIAQLQEWNGLKGSNIQLGQELIVSGGGEKIDSRNVSASAKVESKPSIEQHGSGIIHSVASGQTLSAISRLYGVSVNEIKQLNELKSDNVHPGMQLQIPTPKAMPAERPETPESKLVIDAAKPEPTGAAMASSSGESSKTVSNTMGYTRIVETGFAEMIEDGGNNKKHLCLHRTAPIGSIVQVKNELNGNTVFVRVIGKLPETGPNEKLLVRLSKRAYESLSPAAKRMPVEVSYPSPQSE
jgi:LysM repeat protein